MGGVPTNYQSINYLSTATKSCSKPRVTSDKNIQTQTVSNNCTGHREAINLTKSTTGHGQSKSVADLFGRIRVGIEGKPLNTRSTDTHGITTCEQGEGLSWD